MVQRVIWSKDVAMRRALLYSERSVVLGFLGCRVKAAQASRSSVSRNTNRTFTSWGWVDCSQPPAEAGRRAKVLIIWCHTSDKVIVFSNNTF